MNDKKDEAYNNINKNNESSNQGKNQKNEQNKKFWINTNSKIYNKENQNKIPDIHILNIDSINCRYVNFSDNLIKYSNYGDIKILDLNIKNNININIKNFQFNDAILSNNKINKIIVPNFQIITPTYIKLKTFTLNDFIINNKVNTSNVFIPNLNIIKIRPICIYGDVHFNSNVYLEIKRLININTASASNSPSSNSNDVYDSLKISWDENNGPFNALINNANKFLIIVVNNKYSEFIAINYRDIYRIYNGGFPEIERVENIDKLEKTLQQTGEHKLIIVKDTEKSDHLDKIINNIPYQQSGCIILGTDDVNKFREYNNSSIIIIEDDKFKLIEKYESKLINVVSGFNWNTSKNITFSDFSTNFEKAITNFDDQIEKYSNRNYLRNLLTKELYDDIIRNWDLLINTNSENEKNATYIHAGMKGFIYVYKSNKGYDKIKLEDQNKNESDVYVLSDNTEKYYEAETFFGRGDISALIINKIKKYINYSGKLIFLMRNIDIIRYFYQLKDSLNAFKNCQNFPEIDICGFNFKDNTVMPIRKLVNYLNK